MVTTDGGAARRTARAVKRARLLDSARAAFSAYGYHAASVDDIAARASVTKPIIYRFFPGKVELYRAVLEADADELVARVDSALHDPAGNRAKVEATVGVLFDYVLADGQSGRLIFDPGLRGDTEVTAIVEAALHRVVERITDAVTLDTDLDRERAQLLAAGLVGLSRHGAEHWRTSDRGLPRHESISLMAMLAWKGVSTVPRHPA